MFANDLLQQKSVGGEEVMPFIFGFTNHGSVGGLAPPFLPSHGQP